MGSHLPPHTYTEYAEQVLNELDPGRRVVQHALYREHTSVADGQRYKDLGALGRPLSRVVLVDDSPQNYRMHSENGVSIETYTGDVAWAKREEVAPSCSASAVC